MNGARFGVDRMCCKAALAFAILALVLRLLIPAGFMPATGQGFAITLCTGMGSMQAWVDEHGAVHKGEPVKKEQVEHPCAFAGFGAALDVPSVVGALALPFITMAKLIGASAAPATIGRGLAAPPPPSTGPPSAH
ncbi:hypothetical protein ASE00_02000 [Sphingomonas sp. Root710]|uniref:hypothetical protein n=1 Tax=Sphingomonas sp. Root710 TaxID=1736594 RepID=UPI0006F2D091|nr:hypothetical protein [Sphingomonas sp. Root710]KRB85591.1 hypothetical protein ASE00_02000 [Sphingomonas sp. Root710]